MAGRRYALERGGPRELQLRWRWGMRDFEVLLGPSSWKLDRPLLRSGATIVLPDGCSLFVQHVKPPWWSIGRRKELLVERDRVPVPGSDGHPRVVGRRAARLILLFAFLRIFFIVLWGAFQRGGPRWGGLLAFLPLEAVVLTVLGILAAFGFRLPVVLAAGLFALEVLVVFASGNTPNPIGVLILVIVIVNLVSAWRRMSPRRREPSLASVFE